MKRDWKLEKLGNVCEVFADGDWVESKDQSPSGIRLIQTGNVGIGIFKDRGEKARYVSQETFKRLRCTEIFKGDCLISRLPDPVGRACILPDTGERMITAVDCTIVRFNKKRVIPQFFNYYSQSAKYLSDVDHDTTGTTRKRISRSKLSEIKIPIPPLPEQQRIVALLDETFAALTKVYANAEQNLVNARALFNAVLEEVFSNSGKDYIDTTIGDQITLQRGFDITKSQQEQGKVPVVSSGGIKSYHSVAMAKAPGVVIGRKGTLGKAYYLSEDYWPHDTTLWVKDFKGNNPRLVYYLFLNLDVSKLDSGAANPALNRNIVHPIKIRWAKKEIQQSIVDRLDMLASQAKKLGEIYQCKVDTVEELRKSILQKAFEGGL